MLIACHVHPKNARLPVIVYASHRSENLIGINSLFHGPTDWIVGRRSGKGRFEEVAKDNFPKDTQGNWLALPANAAPQTP